MAQPDRSEHLRITDLPRGGQSSATPVQAHTHDRPAARVSSILPRHTSTMPATLTWPQQNRCILGFRSLLPPRLQRGTFHVDGRKTLGVVDCE